ncbi:MAG TPA: amidohydrolase [Rubricoccaceae bacterium]|nr:amidohydrolase [Rubricoccaceae bacterium]
MREPVAEPVSPSFLFEGGAEAQLTDTGLRETLVALRRHLHAHPEVGFEEHETSRFLRRWFVEQGFDVTGPYAGTGFTVEIAGALPGPTVGYRADMDALPIQDAKEVPYASKCAGVAHLCGHDAHMAVACGVALLVHEARGRMAGSVRLLFQPCEEKSPSGAPRMIAEGATEGLEAIYAIHVDPTLAVGRFGLRVGALTAACAPWRMRVTSGQAGHSARPHETVDTIWVATQILNHLYQLAGRVTDARKPAVLTVTRFHGGEAFNVIPGTVEFGGSLRGTDREGFAFLREKMRRVAGALGALYGADVDVDFLDDLPAVMNTAAEVETIRQAVLARFGPEAVKDLPIPSMGGEDFAWYLEKLPGALVRVGSATGPETRYPLHHARFDIDEAALPLAAHLMAEVLLLHLGRAAAA